MWALGSWDVLRTRKPFFFSNDHLFSLITLQKGDSRPHSSIYDTFESGPTQNSVATFSFLPYGSVCVLWTIK